MQIWVQSQPKSFTALEAVVMVVVVVGCREAANNAAADVILCSHSKLCPNYILPKAIIQPRFTSANWIFLF